MRKYFILFCLMPLISAAQISFEQKMKAMPVIQMANGVLLTVDEPSINPKKPSKLVLYALPNGNTTAQTFGKKLAEGDDWHFNIQHIGAQTQFVRNTDQKYNYIVIYIENSLKSWPQWRRQTVNADQLISEMVDSIYHRYKNLKPLMTLSGHSGGGSFIFGYLNAQAKSLPNYIERIGFIDATYAYETEKHQQKLANWLKQPRKFLQVIAYNDSVVVYNNKPLVSPKGGTWYRSKSMANDIGKLKFKETAEQLNWQNKSGSTSFSLIKNPEGKIFHTVLVERNGFIDLLFKGTKLAAKNYRFWTEPVYQNFILE
ncbi:hypothetical protein [Pedobacter chitinilyticus]|uniref:Alpha/beta hydrolase n=1 Tax=Pedobacter chitinilyticus TaxID=2233776 RepID=A0A443Z1J6_9SPHI|nr:hypothetical protein [Pedobacter chitinilyticus]RWU10411.1 hypothetical protein DPV69_03460 [Pedobacter chitinilyticus]